MNGQIGSESYCPKCGKRLVAQASYCANCGTRVFRDAKGQDTSDPYLGQIIENTFEIQSVLGTGSMGIVYKAYNRTFNNYVALKVLRHDHLSDRVLLTRFQREAQAASSLEHPNVIRIFHFGRTHLNAPYIAMECLSGTELAVLIPREFPLHQQRVCSFALQVARALDAAHRANIIHRDLKPANIVIVNENGQEVVKVLDFGIAKIADIEGEGLTKEGAICGTPAFMSPEQIIGRPVTPASDLFSLGSVMYYMLTCKLPFSGTSMADMASSIMTHEPTPPAKARIDARVHPRLDAICMKALQKDPEKRYRYASEMIADLEAAMLVINDPNAFVKPKIVVGDISARDDLSGETCCEINAMDDDEEEGGTLVEMPVMLDDEEVLRTAKSGVVSTVGSAVEYAISQVLSLKQDSQIGAGEKTIVHTSQMPDDSEMNGEGLLEHRKKLFLGVICIFIFICIVVLLIFISISLLLSDDENKEDLQAEEQQEVQDEPESESIDYGEIFYTVDNVAPKMRESLATGTTYGVAFDVEAILGSTEVVGGTGENTGADETQEAEAQEEQAAESEAEEEAKPEAKAVVKSAPKKKSSRKSSTKKSSTKKSSSKSTTTKSTARRSASASSDNAKSKLKAAQKAEAEGDKVKACSIYKALHEGSEALSQADRVKIMSKVRGCNRISI